ncbi:PREDICTED: uncharacterized protein LOC109593777 [Amphimedon queenslandica]|uniref:DUF4190 domain-containing protein n=1 Tax=Amphimedon queenslandica TaxID=400682 RepID=A0AAN0K554_AMPQE|nr:PREDICTED: uncharacterized protein LOC109593777 [Amphimedon queenslandica]|eukprot:XP_019864441.1 PREDICTED: uncharacterized protein LOC109593777 [Amphimedon queenslandica]
MLQRQQQQQLQEEAMGTSMGTILHLIIVIIITVICALFNITSLISVGIPAIICSSMAYRNKKKEKYATAKKLGYMAYFLSLFNIIFTAIFAIMAIIATSFSFMS